MKEMGLKAVYAKPRTTIIDKTHNGAVANKLFRRTFRNSKFFKNVRKSRYAFFSKNLES
jgi:hypothetical protein